MSFQMKSFMLSKNVYILFHIHIILLYLYCRAAEIHLLVQHLQTVGTEKRIQKVHSLFLNCPAANHIDVIFYSKVA